MSGWTMTIAGPHAIIRSRAHRAEPERRSDDQEFWGGMAASLCRLGNAYAEKRFIGNRLVVRWSRCRSNTHPDRTHNRDGDLEYRYRRPRQGRVAAARQGVPHPRLHVSARAISACRRSMPRGRR
jgi:phage portal protein BeeE